MCVCVRVCALRDVAQPTKFYGHLLLNEAKIMQPSTYECGSCASPKRPSDAANMHQFRHCGIVAASFRVASVRI